MPHFLGSYLVVIDIFFLSIIYFTDKDDLIVIHSDESLDLSRSDYLDNELSSLVSKTNAVRCITFLFTNCKPIFFSGKLVGGILSEVYRQTSHSLGEWKQSYFAT
jgi:hypothetical protein